jgi:hypothetical protein
MLRHLPILCMAAWAMGASVPKPATPVIQGAMPQVDRVPVLVELFTSESCSVCPAAGNLLENLEQKQPIPGVEVIGLEMQMDSWSGGGWRDPFALRQMTNRQNEYVRLFKLDSVYLPQMVIGGQTQVEASDPAQAAEEIARAARSRRANVEVAFQSASVATVKVDGLPSSARESEVWMAVTESPAHHTAVVRSLVMLGPAEPGEPTTYSMHLRFNPRWNRQDLKYVIFVQERISRRIWGATAVTP